MPLATPAALLPAKPMSWGELRASAALCAIMEELLLELALSCSAMAAVASTGCASGPMHSDALEPLLVSSACHSNQSSLIAVLMSLLHKPAC